MWAFVLKGVFLSNTKHPSEELKIFCVNTVGFLDTWICLNDSAICSPDNVSISKLKVSSTAKFYSKSISIWLVSTAVQISKKIYIWKESHSSHGTNVISREKHRNVLLKNKTVTFRKLKPLATWHPIDVDCHILLQCLAMSFVFAVAQPRRQKHS